MSIRDFLRGGYQTIKEPTVVMKHGYPSFTVWPGPPRERPVIETIKAQDPVTPAE